MSNAEAWPTEALATRAVDAAARRAFEIDVEARRKVFPPSAVFPDWDDLDATQKLALREAVLPIVWAALSDLPDPRRNAWFDGLYLGRGGALAVDNPYPEPV